MPRAFAIVAGCLALPVALVVALLGEGAGRYPAGAGRLVPNPALSEVYLSALCRPPTDRETLEWEGRPVDAAALTMGLGLTGGPERVSLIRQQYRDRLGRTATRDDCPQVRVWTDAGASLDDVRRELASSAEGRRVDRVRAVFVVALGRDPLGWDDLSLRRWVDGPWTLPEIKDRLVHQRPLVGVHYFTWYGFFDNRWGNGLTPVPSDSPRPVLGQYTSSDPAVIRTHLRQMTDLGIDFVIVHIVAQKPQSWANARTLFRFLSGQPLKAAVVVDGLYAESAAAKATWVERVRDEFAAHPNYFMVEGRPLVMLYSSRLDFTVSGIELRNVYWNTRYDPGFNTFNGDLRLDPRDWPFWSPTPQPLVNGVVPVIPGYIDTQLGRDRTMEHRRDEGRLYRAQWARALSLRPEFILIYSWNEYFERTAIEPTDAWGDEYLRLTACFVAHAHRGGNGACP